MMKRITFILCLFLAPQVWAQDTIEFGAGGGNLPSQTGESGKYLTTDGSNPSWATLSGGGDMAAATYDAAGKSDQVLTESDQTGADAGIVSGTAGDNGDVVIWNGDGDAVEGSPAPSGSFVGTSDTQTLTNKTIDGDDNTLLDIDVSALETVTGSDAAVVTGTAGTSGNLVQWDANGDAVDGPAPSTFEAADSAIAKVDEAETVTGAWDFGGGSLEIPNGTTLPGTCDVGDQFMDTDAASGQRHYLCESTDTWALQGDGGGGGSGDSWGDAVDADVVPDGDGTRDLGSSSNRFANIHVDSIDLNGSTITNATFNDGLEFTGGNVNTKSDEAAFLEDGGSTSLTCSSLEGAMQVMDNGDLEYCDGGDTLRTLSESGSVSADSIGTDELDDASDTPASGEWVQVDTDDQAGFTYRSDSEAISDLGIDSDITSLTIGASASVSGSNTGDQTTITGNAGTATALAANGGNCSAGNYPLGVDASGAVESCTADDDVPEAGDFDNLTQCDLAITIEDPGDAEDVTFGFKNIAVTISEIRAVLIGSSTPSVTWTLRHGTDRSATGNEAVTSGTTTTSVTSGSDVTSFDDETVAADSFIWLETTAQSGTVDELHITACYSPT